MDFLSSPALILILLPLAAYMVLIALFTRGWYSFRPFAKAFPKPPEVCVIIAARNEEQNISGILEDLAVQSYPAELLQVIVVNDGSSDSTETLVQSFISSRSLVNFRILKSGAAGPEGSKKAAITTGIAEANGKIIVTTDADCQVGPEWISALTAYFEDQSVQMVFGPVACQAGSSLSEQFQALEFAGLVASGAGAALAGRPFLCNGANLAYRKDAFFEVKGFAGNEKYISGDDVFLLHKMKKAFGSRAIIFSKETRALVRTLSVPGWVPFLRQRARWASKSMGYQDSLSSWAAIIVFALNLALVIIFFAGIFLPYLFLVAAGVLVLKMIADLPLMLGITGFTRQRRLMKGYVFFQLIYPAYIITAAITGLFKRKSWK